VADDFTSLWNRLQNRAAVGPVLAQQLVNDSWHTLQAMEEWSWRRRASTFAPPDLYQTGTVTTNVGAGNPFLLTGLGTTWTPSMLGRQIRVGGLLYPYYTIVSWLSPTQILIDAPWAGADVVAQTYQILQCYFPVPDDFGYFNLVVSIKDGYRIYTELTQGELGLLDPQRTNQGQTYGIAFRDFTPQLGGIIGPVIPVSSPTDPGPVSTTATGFTYPAPATYIVQVVLGGVSGVATFTWLRAGQGLAQPAQITDVNPQDLADGVQVYWPDTVNYVAGDLFIINCVALLTQSVPRYELWPAPTFSGYLYPYIYFAKEYDLSASAPSLPPFVANRGEILLEMALEKCAMLPAFDNEHPNPYYDLKLSQLHRAHWTDMMIDFRNNDQNVGINALGYQNLSYAGPFTGPYGVQFDGSWLQRHAPTL
jgi:hypothetical protein